MPNTRAMLLMAIALALTPTAQAYERTLTSDGAYLYSFAAGSVMITSTTGDAGFDNSLREIYADGSNVRITGTFELQLVSRDETSERYLTSTALDMLFGLTPITGGTILINSGSVNPRTDGGISLNTSATISIIDRSVVDLGSGGQINLQPGGQVSLNGVGSGSGGTVLTGGTNSGSIQIVNGGGILISRTEVPAVTIATIPRDISSFGGNIYLNGSNGIVIENRAPSGTLPPGVLQGTLLLPAVPEPSSALMLALGGLALAGVIARRRRV